MSTTIKKRDQKMYFDEEAMDMLRQAVFDDVVECPKCGSKMEPDAEKCGECGFSGTLRGMGLI